MSVSFNYNEENLLVCQHGNTHSYGGDEKCTDCGAIYDETIMDWVPEEGAL